MQRPVSHGILAHGAKDRIWPVTQANPPTGESRRQGIRELSRRLSAQPLNVS
jgi:hypothetical protein